MKNDEVVYFELNNWFSGTDYPSSGILHKWMCNDFKQKFRNEEWIKRNGLIVVHSLVDMSMNYCITAKRSWVEKRCPSLFNEKNRKFLRFPEEGEDVPEGRFGGHFLSFDEYEPGLYLDIEEEDSQGYYYYRVEKV